MNFYDYKFVMRSIYAIFLNFIEMHQGTERSFSAYGLLMFVFGTYDEKKNCKSLRLANDMEEFWP